MSIPAELVADIERGRELVRQGVSKPARQVDYIAMSAYWDTQRQAVLQGGGCQAGCDRVELVEVGPAVVCPHTMWACPRQRFSLLVKFFKDARRMAENELALADSEPIVPQSDMQRMIAIDTTSRQCARQLLEAGANEAAKALITARAIGQLSSLLNDRVMADIMPLQNSILGFRTDKQEGYGQTVVRNCVTIALMRGLRITGNEWNIIAGNLYVTKEGYARLLAELPGFANLRMQVSVPKMAGEGALVAVTAEWTYQGKERFMRWEETKTGDYRIAVKVNKGMGADAILGKARSKALRQIHQTITGSRYESIGDADDSQVDGELASEHQNMEAVSK